MIVPIEWLKQYIKTDKSAKDISDSFTSLGLMLDRPIERDILDLEHRMDRADWLSIIGCARDFAAFENIDLTYPEFFEGGYEKIDKPQIKIEVKSPEALQRFNTVVIKGITVKESPDWLKKRIEQYGIPSINNIVDITNYVMVEMGQPLHAQDINKLEKPEIIIREARKGEKIVTLLGETIELKPKTYVLTQNDKPTVILGVVGGKATCVDENTVDIVLDAGNYNQSAIRQSSRILKIQNETVARCDKFLHPKLTEVGLKRAIKLILELAGGTVYENQDWYPEKWDEKEMTLRYSRIEKIGGIKFKPEDAKNIIEKLEYKILEESEKGLKLKVPYFRTDVVVEDDIVSDILRIYGYENIPVTALRETPPVEITPEIYKFEEQLRDLCVHIGLHEHITEPLLKDTKVTGNKVILENALSSEANCLRTDVYQTLFPVTKIYKKHGISTIKLFEIGLEYSKAGEAYEDYREVRKLEIIYHNEHISIVDISKEIKNVLATILHELGITNYELTAGDIIVEKCKIGAIKVDSINIETEKLMRKSREMYVKRIKSDYETVKSGDLSLVMSTDTKIGKVIETIKNTYADKIENVWTIEQLLDNNNGQDRKTVLLRIEYHNGRFDQMKTELTNKLEKTFGIKSRS